MTFPGAHSTVYYNEAGEPLGWDDESYFEPPYEPDDNWYDPDDGTDEDD